MDKKISSTLGYERAYNSMLREEDEDTFAHRAIEKLGPQPPNFHAIVDLNRGELLTTGVDLLPLAPRQVEQKRTDGALLVDARTDLQFDDAHIPGAVAIPAVQAGFGTRLAWLAGPGQEIVLVGRDEHDARHAARLALAVGMRTLGGFLAGGMTDWRREDRPVTRLERLALEDLPGRRREDPSLQVLDVREADEHRQGFIPGSLFSPWHGLADLPEGLDPDRPVAVVCASGQRAGVAASLLQRHGLEQVIHVVDGGVPKWARLGEPIEQ